MTPREEGFLLLTSFLGDPERKPLTHARFRELVSRARTMERPTQERELTCVDLMRIGYSQAAAEHILILLSQQKKMESYVRGGAVTGCSPLTRISQGYPGRLHQKLSTDAPAALWTKGDIALLSVPKISLVGSRELQPYNLAFAREVGKQAALQGYALVSGNARGADREAQEACLDHGGCVISVVADELQYHAARENMLYVSEEGYDLTFSAQRALQRNRIIHALGEKVFVAQCRLGKGGTWKGTEANLRKGWSPVFCCDDGTAAATQLQQRGATLIKTGSLSNIAALQNPTISFIDP